jgi:hypothetical protein
MAMQNTELDWWEARNKEKEKKKMEGADHTLYWCSLRGPTWVIASQPHNNNNTSTKEHL